ncbi:helix-turn-helix transcriptional regulator [Campylobacter sp. RM16190]|uniref:helix-turn-helix domain-containing protein n=1 Tax=Campylobacter sp. RM16190 TaxID=1705727 RepID=UPI0014761FA0|nr:helix-turn-helix transcriptional regulator [Campylobacter sp. RM16190]
MKVLPNAKLEQIRRKNKITRKGLENISGFKERTIGSYERAENFPSDEYLDFISLYFGYTKDYIIKDTYEYELNKFVRVVLMYQSIFNYTDEKMAEILKIAPNEYKKIYNFNNYSKGLIYKYNDLSLLGIKPSCVGLDVEGISIDRLMLYYYSTSHSIDEVRKAELIKKEENRIKEAEKEKKILSDLEKNGLNLTPEYYASIIKKRNTPEKITPLNTLSDIPPKHQELLELLKFAPDSFTDEIIKKLKEIKKLQEF